MIIDAKPTIEPDWAEDLAELSTAEEFLDFFALDFDQDVVHVNRLHILQRFHNYLRQAEGSLPDDPEANWGVHQALLQRAYQDFVESDAQTEKVFKVFHSHGDCHSIVTLEVPETLSKES